MIFYFQQLFKKKNTPRISKEKNYYSNYIGLWVENIIFAIIPFLVAFLEQLKETRQVRWLFVMDLTALAVTSLSTAFSPFKTILTTEEGIKPQRRFPFPPSSKVVLNIWLNRWWSCPIRWLTGDWENVVEQLPSKQSAFIIDCVGNEGVSRPTTCWWWTTPCKINPGLRSRAMQSSIVHSASPKF